VTTALSHPAERRSGARRGIGRAAELVLCALAFFAAALAFAADGDPVSVPRLATHVTDLTGTLSSGQRSSLDSKLAAWEGRTGGQFAVLLVSTTKPGTPASFSRLQD